MRVFEEVEVGAFPERRRGRESRREAVERIEAGSPIGSAGF